MELKEFFGLTGTVAAFISFVVYLRAILGNKIKPHPFTWLVFAILTAIIFLGQISDNAGPGSWATAVSFLVYFTIFFLSLTKKNKNIVFFDWVSLISAVIIIILYITTKDALASTVLASICLALGFIPTFRKSYMKPKEENMSLFFLSGVKYTFALVALENVSLITALYPIVDIILDVLLVSMLVIRRKQLS